MSEREEEIQNNEQENTFLSYNFAIAKIKMINENYSEQNKEMCEVALLGVLTEIMNNEEVYHRVLEAMRNLDLYERYLRCILEVQFLPKMQTGEGKGNGEQSENGNNSNGNNAQNHQSNSNSNVATKADKSKINQKFIRDLFNDEGFNI